MSDSGTMQKECSIFNIPNVTLRDVTELPETIECGSNILSGADPDRVLAAVPAALKTSHDWTAAAEYTARNLSRTVAIIVLGYLHALDARR